MACLTEFLARAEARRFQPGEWDCCLMVADWVRECTGIDGAAPWRGRYRTVQGFLRHLRAGGGVEGVMSQGAALAGLRETMEPKRGDIGVIEAAGAKVGAICTGRQWVAVGQRGLSAIAAEPLRAWRV